MNALFPFSNGRTMPQHTSNTCASCCCCCCCCRVDALINDAAAAAASATSTAASMCSAAQPFRRLSFAFCCRLSMPRCLSGRVVQLVSLSLSLSRCVYGTHAMLLVARLYVSNLQLVVRLFLYHKLASLFPLPSDRAKLACSPSFFMSLRISTLSHDAAIVAIVAMCQLCCCCCCRVLLLC